MSEDSDSDDSRWEIVIEASGVDESASVWASESVEDMPVEETEERDGVRQCEIRIGL